MATEEQKQQARLQLLGTVLAGFITGLYKLFGDGAMATVDTIGQDVLKDMEHKLGLEIHGEDPQDILTELERLMIDEFGLLQDAKLVIEGGKIALSCEKCMLWNLSRTLQEAEVPLYSCVPMMMASTALRKRLRKKAKFMGITQDQENHICNIEFRLLD
ncbi:MAG: hypothetical protein JXA37_05680 [Chloroflexia bacterium]|nr:hypothetical protein [Chloroflexia bacterium]